MVWIVMAAPAAWSQKGIEIAPFVVRQLNGGLDISTAVFNRIDAQNGMSYGISGVYLLGEYTGVEFMWNHNKADTRAQFMPEAPPPRYSNSTPINIWEILSFKGREHRFRPFLFASDGNGAFKEMVTEVALTRVWDR
jgi:hypothetical protein